MTTSPQLLIPETEKNKCDRLQFLKAEEGILTQKTAPSMCQASYCAIALFWGEAFHFVANWLFFNQK
jgi:hypothetical protein